jgi:N-acetylneuraminic acid mutarotase
MAENVAGDSSGPEPSSAASGDETSVPKQIASFKEVEPLKWQQVKTSAEFTERVGHALISCSKTGKIYMLGGGNHGGDINEVWVLDYNSPASSEGLGWERMSVKEFSGRYEFAAALDSEQERIWVFGGADFQTPRNDVCYLDLEGKEFVTKFGNNPKLALETREGDETKDFGVPFPRTQGGNSCLVQVGERTYMAVYGGGVKGELAVPDGHLYLYDVESGEWERVLVTGDTPGLRQGHVMTSVGTKIFVHGGMHEFAIFDDLHSIDLQDFREKTPAWFKIQTEVHPGGRAAQGIAKDGTDIYIFGGLGEDGTLGDLWKFDTDKLQWTAISDAKVASPRLDAAMTLVDLGEGSDESGGSKKILLVHGGMNTEGTLFKDFWALALPQK